MYRKNIIFIAVSFIFILASCEKGEQEKEEEKENFRDIALGETFTMIPGETVRFFLPFEYKLTLVKFDDYIKMEGFSPSAVANFEYKTEFTNGGLGIQLNEDQIENGPIYFSGCNPGKITNGTNVEIPVYFITEEIEFEEQSSKFIFKSIRFRMILDYGDPEFLCTS